MEGKAFKKELEVLAQIQLYKGYKVPSVSTAGLPELLGFAFSHKDKKAELMMSHCGLDLNNEWLKYM